MARYTNLKNALEFNKVTVALAVAGMAAAVESGNHSKLAAAKIVFTISAILFCLSLLWGLMVFGRASQLSDTSDHSPLLAHLGRWHLIFLGLGSIPVAVVAFLRIWGLFE